MKNTAQGESQVLYLPRDTPSAVFRTHKHTPVGGALNGILYLTTVNSPVARKRKCILIAYCAVAGCSGCTKNVHASLKQSRLPLQKVHSVRIIWYILII